MLEEKYQWKAAYLWIKYLNYTCVHFDKEKNEVWLAHRKRAHIVIFKYSDFTTQEIKFTFERLKEHQHEIVEFLTFKVKKYDVYLLNDKEIDVNAFHERHPVKIQFHQINSKKALLQFITHPILKRELQSKDTKSLTFYKQRTLNQNPVEHAMYQFAPMTYSLIAVNIFIWLCILLFAPHRTDLEIINLGALSHFNFIHGEVYRLITSMFLHLNFEHLLFNMLSLFIFGKLVESFIGYWRMLVVYLFAGGIGNLFSLAFINASFSLGASGAIFGLIGALIAMMLISKQFTQKMMLQIITAAIVMAVITLFMRNVNVIAHLTGLFAGGFATYIGYYYQTFKKGFKLLLVVLIILIVGLLIRIFLIDDINIYNKIIQNEMNNGEISEAKHMINETMDRGYADDETYYLAGFVIAAKESKAEAMAEWERGLRIFPNSVPLNYQMAIANRSLGDNKSAKKFVKKALENDPQNQNVLNLKKELDD